MASTVKVDPARGFDVSFASVSVAASGANPVIAAVTGKKIRVLSYTLVADGAVTAKWRTAASADLSGAMSLAANGSLGSPLVPLMETVAGEALTLTLGGAVGVRGHITYQLV
jgi:hypothetical protein